ncbi:hypothetical protein [Hyphomonas sp.]|uniref:hypothetical protein n=1 Tax=Hyphomonas sp. TaxID=87 RepID=UPI00300269A9
MIDISLLLKGVDEATARSALYYAGRYIKQASDFQKYSKDIFEDEIRSAPSEEVKRLTLYLINEIELRAGQEARNFTDALIVELLDDITAAEDSLARTFTDDEIAKANSFIETIDQFFRK